ncbi:HNH endonuclease [Paraburkholderia sp. EG287B]|uniref:HNH endonuclease n=1 Tax=Paraburkholderia sp. EG287B TaxID=3237010 RepID=UPI0034D3305F
MANRSDNVKDCPHADQWLHDHPDVAENLGRIVEFMSRRYAGNSKGYINRNEKFVEYRFSPVEGERQFGFAQLLARQKHVVVRFFTPRLRKRGPGIPKMLKGATADQINYTLDFQVTAETDLDHLDAFLRTTVTFSGKGKSSTGKRTAAPAQPTAPANTSRRAKPLSAAEAIAQADTLAQQERAKPIGPEEDARVQELRTVFLRRGQAKFRKALLKAYEKQCAITGCAMEDVLEAAHIKPYKGEATHRVDNGLLLRADIHTLFDLGLLWINSRRQVEVARELRGTEYWSLHLTSLRSPKDPALQPHANHLKDHAAYAKELRAARR